jgi:hypothetical protein
VVWLTGVLHVRAEEPVVSLLTDEKPGPAASHGAEKLMGALRAKGGAGERAASLDAARGKFLIVAGRAEGGGPAARLLKAGKHPAPQGPEALVIRRTEWNGKPVWLVAGSDDRGVMYAELDVADRVGWGTDPGAPLAEVREAAERPDVRERAMSVYTMNRAYWESRFYDKDYWARYLDLLAKNRFNSLVVVFGYENGGFLAPCYPYFFDVEQFPDVRMVGMTGQQQRRNLDALNRLIDMAHARGLSVTVGIWDHIYRGGVQGGGISGADKVPQKPTPGLVWGLTEKNLTAYTCAALAEFLRLVPGVDAVQFRMHDESGLKGGEQEAFWREVFRVMKEHGPKDRFDARAKGLPDSVIDAGLEADVNLRITTKYWMEQMGLPFHPTHINRQNQFDRRHSYADLLRYPQRYKVHWALERRHGAGTPVGQPGVRAAVRREHAPLRRRRLRGQRAAVHQDGGPAPRPEAVRPAEREVPPLRLRVRALLALFPGVRADGLQPEHASGGVAAGIREPLWQGGRAAY